MSQLAHLRQKIKAIQTTKKVTHAIRLVSMSLYSKLEKQNTTLKNYTNIIQAIFKEYVDSARDWQSQVLLPGKPIAENPLFIVISSSRGLCGSLNSNLFRYLENMPFMRERQNLQFITIGTKAYKFIKENSWGSLVCSYNELNSNNFITVADSLVEKIINTPLSYSSVILVGTERRSFFSQKPREVCLIPVDAGKIDAPTDEVAPVESRGDEVIWEQPKNEILDQLAIGYLRSTLIEALFQSLLSEHAARFLAMDNSTTNAEKYLERLTLQYNKARQAGITKEVSELSAGVSG